MQLKKYLSRLQLIDNLIKEKKTGTPAELARYLDISERMLYEYINTLKEFDAPICYSSKYRSYIYKQKWHFLGGKEVSESVVYQTTH